MKKEIKAIIFDVGGVIYIGEQKSNEYVYKKLGLSKEKYFNLIENILDKLIRGKIKSSEGIRKMALKLEVSEEKLEKIWREAIKKRFILNKELMQIIKQLKKDYKIAILSDQWDLPYRILINNKIKKNFDVLTFSHKIYFRKPSPKIYKETLKKLKLKPSQCIFIDDKGAHLAPAKKLRIKTILFKNNKKLIKDLNKMEVNLK